MSTATLNGKAKIALATQQMTLSGFKVMPMGLVANKDITREQWKATGAILGAIHKKDYGEALQLIAEHIATEGK